jgi:hypothetical protein
MWLVAFVTCCSSLLLDQTESNVVLAHFSIISVDPTLPEFTRVSQKITETECIIWGYKLRVQHDEHVTAQKARCLRWY